VRSMDPSPSAADAAPLEAPSRLSRAGALLRPTLVVGLLTFAAGVVCGNVLPTRAELAGTQKRLDDEREENARLKRRLVALRAQASQLEQDPWATERILRDELKMSGDDEVIVR
jgi:cell division protein FtsB